MRHVHVHVHVHVHLVGVAAVSTGVVAATVLRAWLQLRQPRLSELQGKLRLVSRLPCTNWDPDSFGLPYLDPCLGTSCTHTCGNA